MKTQYTILMVILSSVLITSQLSAQNTYPYTQYQNNYQNNYDISEYLDLEAVASVFGESRHVEDFENRLNDYRNQVSNLDLNHDGYVDYLRLVKLFDRNTHVLLIQAVLGVNYYQDVATVIVGKDRYNRDLVQFVGDDYLYGRDYILEPVFYKRPRIVKWLWRNTRVYVSRYHWGYYPRYYRMRYVLPILHYFDHVRVFIDVHHRYHYTHHRRHSLSFDDYHRFRKNDYWKSHSDKRFDQRNRSIQNKGYFQHNQVRQEADVRQRNYQDVRSSENNRRSSPGVVVPQRDANTRQVNPPASDRKSSSSGRGILQRNTRTSTQRSTTVTPRTETNNSTRREVKVTPERETRTTTQKEVQVTPRRETKTTTKKEKTTTSSRTTGKRSTRR